jgi:hypothetical protein
MTSGMNRSHIQPRLIRHRDAPAYLGMDKNRFNQEVRPFLLEIPLGRQGIAFDRLDLDAWVDHYKACNGRPTSTNGGLKVWDATGSQDFESVGRSGISKSRSVEKRFAKALAQAISKKQR